MTKLNYSLKNGGGNLLKALILDILAGGSRLFHCGKIFKSLVIHSLNLNERFECSVFQGGSNIKLTPHLTSPPLGRNEVQLLCSFERKGIYNHSFYLRVHFLGYSSVPLNVGCNLLHLTKPVGISPLQGQRG